MNEDNILNFKKFDNVDWLNPYTGELISEQEYWKRAREDVQPTQILAHDQMLADDWIVSPVQASA